MKLSLKDGRGYCEPQKALTLCGFVTRWAAGAKVWSFLRWKKHIFLQHNDPLKPPPQKKNTCTQPSTLLLFQVTAAVPPPLRTASCFFFCFVFFYSRRHLVSKRGAPRQVKPAVPKPHCSFLLDWTVISRPLESTTRCPARQNTALTCT